jgi:hypothetical protein
MKKDIPVTESAKKARSEQMRKTNADRAREAREREERSLQAAARLSDAMGMPTARNVAP